MVSEKDYLYFAYGHDLVAEEVQRRIPSAKLVATCSLRGYALGFFGPAGQPSVYRSRGDQVCGVLWRLAAADAARLPQHYKLYRPEQVVVHDVEDTVTTYSSVMYALPAGQQQQPALPSPRLKQQLVDGARQHGLPALYLHAVLLPIATAADRTQQMLLDDERLLID